MSDGVAVPPDTSPHSLAEYIEAVCLVEGISHLSAAELRARFPSGQQPSSQEISFGMSEVEIRAQTLGTAYPYLLQSGGVLRVESELSPVYDFMTMLSLESTPMRIAKSYQRSDPLFDALVREATKAQLGDGAQAICFGWPPRDGRPTGFGEAVTWIGARIGIPDGVLDRPTEEKDAGVDVIAWKPFPDGRTGFPVYLIQNTVRADYASKPRDVVPNSWVQWLRFGTPPHIGFAIPFSVPRGDDRWVKINDTADLILDRFRITKLIAGVEVNLLPELVEIKKFVAEEISVLITDQYQPASVARPRKQRKSATRDDRVR